MIYLHLLGPTELRRSDGTSVASVLAQPKRLALLAWLAIYAHHGFARRDSVLALFWPEADEERSRSALSQALHYLRRSLGEDVPIRRGDAEIGVDEGALWCDVVAFREAVAAGRHEPALELYRGELLPGLIVQDAPAFQDWLDRERNVLRGMATGSARALAQDAADAGRMDEAVGWAARARAVAGRRRGRARRNRDPDPRWRPRRRDPRLRGPRGARPRRVRRRAGRRDDRADRCTPS